MAINSSEVEEKVIQKIVYIFMFPKKDTFYIVGWLAHDNAEALCSKDFLQKEWAHFLYTMS